jgi:hypothetical protein
MNSTTLGMAGGVKDPQHPSRAQNQSVQYSSIASLKTRLYNSSTLQSPNAALNKKVPIPNHIRRQQFQQYRQNNMHISIIKIPKMKSQALIPKPQPDAAQQKEVSYPSSFNSIPLQLYQERAVVPKTGLRRKQIQRARYQSIKHGVAPKQLKATASKDP